MFGLADCNNFFVSCEQVFNPGLNGKPVIVLSNNDGCVISRSNEAKALGIKMGQPYYQLKEFISRYHVAVFSSNFALYGDMSQRVQQTLQQIVPATEIYSIDECFLDLQGIDKQVLDALGHRIAKTVRQNTGIPISVGIAPTKTLAKIASKLSKQYPKLKGSCYLYRPQDIDKVLRRVPIDDVWGIGRKFTTKLKNLNIHTAYDFTQFSADTVRGLMHVGGLKTWKELHGIPCIEFEEFNKDKQQIAITRSFHHELTDLDDLQQQIALFTSMAAEKLRSQHSVCHSLYIFLVTNRHRTDKPQQFANRLVPLATDTDSTLELVGQATRVTRELVRQPFEYKRAGVILSDIRPKTCRQTALFDPINHDRQNRLMDAVDAINRREGSGKVVVAVAGFEGVRMNRQHLSPRYTTNWEDIITIRCRPRKSDVTPKHDHL